MQMVPSGSCPVITRSDRRAFALPLLVCECIPSAVAISHCSLTSESSSKAFQKELKTNASLGVLWALGVILELKLSNT